MQQDRIAEISVDREGRLCVRPESAQFPHIYREAMEVDWDPAARCLISPTPREWTYARWFQQILAAAGQQGFALVVDDSTTWTNADSIKLEIVSNGPAQWVATSN